VSSTSIWKGVKSFPLVVKALLAFKMERGEKEEPAGEARGSD
jgi:hypothetical protein